MNRKTRLSILALFLGFTSGCANMDLKIRDWLGASEAPQHIRVSDNLTPKPVDRTDNPAVDPNRITSKKLKELSSLGEKSGSLWVMEGQGSYLFAQNTARMVGAVLPVVIDGEPRKQIETKVKVIRDLLVQYEEKRQKELADLVEKEKAAAHEASQAKPAEGAAGQATAIEQRNPATAAPGKESVASAKASENMKKLPEGATSFDLQSVTTRVVEKLPDGNYRVEGDEAFMIADREYHLKVAGVVRPEDYTETGFSAEKLLTPKFDIVSPRPTEVR